MAQTQPETRAAIAATRRAELRALLAAGATCHEAARSCGVTPQYVAALRRRLPAYLDDPAFKEPHIGPAILGAGETAGRDPSPDQIRRRCEAIRRHAPRPPQGVVVEWELPLLVEPVMGRRKEE